MLFIIHHPLITAKGGCLWQRNNGNAKIRIPWWNISLMVTPVCAESSVNTAAKLSTLRPETANIAASRPAATRCWTYAKASESVLSAERTPALAVGSSSYQFGQMPDIAAMPVGKKSIENVLQMLQVLKMSTWISVTHLPNETQFLTNEGTEIYRPVTENQVVKMSTSFFRNASRPVENQVAKRTTWFYP